MEACVYLCVYVYVRGAVDGRSGIGVVALWTIVRLSDVYNSVYSTAFGWLGLRRADLGGGGGGTQPLRQSDRMAVSRASPSYLWEFAHGSDKRVTVTVH